MPAGQYAPRGARFPFLAVTAFVLLGLPAGVFGQDAEPPEPTADNPLAGEAELSFVSTQGNTSTSTLGIGGVVAFRLDAWLTESSTAFVTSSNEGVENARRFATDVRLSRPVRERLDAYVLNAYLRNRFAGIRHRYDGEVGVTARVIETPRQDLLVDGGVGYGRELRFEAPRQTDALATLGARHRLAISATSELTNEAGYRVAFGDAGNWRGSYVIALTAALNSLFSLRLSHDLWYVHEPVPGFGTTDRIASAALLATF